jgi:hypothetical protein
VFLTGSHPCQPHHKATQARHSSPKHVQAACQRHLTCINSTMEQLFSLLNSPRLPQQIGHGDACYRLSIHTSDRASRFNDLDLASMMPLHCEIRRGPSDVFR